MPSGRAARADAAPSVEPIATAIGAPCVLASERASHPESEQRSAKTLLEQLGAPGQALGAEELARPLDRARLEPPQPPAPAQLLEREAAEVDRAEGGDVELQVGGRGRALGAA